MMDCMDCGQPIDLDAFPNFVDSEVAKYYAKRCAECTVQALWRFLVDDRCEIDDPDALDVLANLVVLDGLCPDCGEPWPVTETIRVDGSLGCPCQEKI